MSEPRRVVRVSPNTLYREVQGEAILLQLDSGEYFGLDSVANRIWQLIVEQGDLGAVAEALAAEYDADDAVLARDLEQMVNELVAKRLVDVETPSQDSSAR